ncbi:MAG: hypothetical protein NTX25_03765 [Proteobacteria bacterium]|nr:hypothetical protein [Pseudomonadota bacterium]
MKLLRFAAMTAFLLSSGSAFAQSHSLIDRNRSSMSNNVFLIQAIDGEFGQYSKKYKTADSPIQQTWRGYGIRNGLGVELFKFTQFSLSHTLLNMRSKESSLENMRGSKLSGEISFAFSAPITNIQFGLGLVASQMDYQNLQETGSFVGTGHYYDMGANYFFSPAFSLQVIGKHSEIQHAISTGSLSLESIESSTDSLSIGLAIWI